VIGVTRIARRRVARRHAATASAPRASAIAAVPKDASIIAIISERTAPA
jgi:hypothetical protein